MDPHTEPKKSNANSVLGVTLGDIHTDEPHQGITADSMDTDEAKEPRSHLTNHGGVFNVEKAFTGGHHEEGTIVSDKRRHRMSFMESLRSAFDEWSGNAKTEIEKFQKTVPLHRPNARPMMVPAESRKDTVAKAAQHASIAPRDDSQSVIGSIRTFKSDVAAIQGKTLIKPKVEKDATWEHPEKTAEKVTPQKAQPATSSPLPTKPRNAPSIVVPDAPQKIARGVYVAPTKTAPPNTPVKKPVPFTVPEHKKEVKWTERSFAVAPVVTPSYSGMTANKTDKKDVQPVPIEKPKATWVSAPEPKVVPQPKTPPPSPKPTVATERPADTSSDVSAVSEPSLEMKPVLRSVPIPDTTKQDIEKTRTQQKTSVSQNATPAKMPWTQRTSVRYAMLGVVLLSLGALGVVLTPIISTRLANQETPTPITVDPVIPASSRIGSVNSRFVPLGESSSMFLTSLYEEMVSAPTGLIQFFPTVLSGGVSRIVTSSELLSFINARITPHTVRALSDTVKVGSITTTRNEPFIVFSSNDFDSLFVGLLAWEASLQDDFAPLFGIATPSGQFTDTIRGNAPARVLRDAQGKEVLIYSIIDRDTVIITTSSEALTILVSQIQ